MAVHPPSDLEQEKVVNTVEGNYAGLLLSGDLAHLSQEQASSLCKCSPKELTLGDASSSHTITIHKGRVGLDEAGWWVREEWQDSRALPPNFQPCFSLSSQLLADCF